jgi:hypothetical protein
MSVRGQYETKCTAAKSRYSITSSAATSNVDGTAKPSFRRLEIDHQLKFGRPLHRQVGRFGSIENLIDEDGGAPAAELVLGNDGGAREIRMYCPQSV